MGEAFSPTQCELLADSLEEMGFFDAPASTCFHGAHPGGLFDHSAEVTEQLLRLTRGLGLQWGVRRARISSECSMTFASASCTGRRMTEALNGEKIFRFRGMEKSP